MSDALHERLTRRFVDRRTSVLQKRLRENAMLEAEISPTGAVLVEGHHVGELNGFRFTPDQQASGEDARAVRQAAQKALAGEFEARAERFAHSPNNDLAIAADGTLRWIGQPVGALAGADDALAPRVVLLADEQLTGPARDKVQARADRYVQFQVASLLKPLADLRSGETMPQAARGIAFRIAEAFGVIDRRDIADEVRALDNEARAALRRHGVRIGAFHLFLPALLKPAPASLATLLWALKHDARDHPGHGEVVAALAAGRTSLAVDPTFDRSFYRLAGFRLLGSRAVRIDILERLADLIRPALAWRKGAGPRPEAAFDGRAFLVTPAMLSILGARPDDMDDILKGLGYRGETRKAAEVKSALEAVDAEHAAAEAAKKAAAADGPAPDALEAPADADAALDAPADADAAPAIAPGDDEGDAPDTPDAAPAAADHPVALEQAAPVAATQADGEPEKTVMLWRLHRFERREHPPRHGRQQAEGGKQERTGRPPRRDDKTPARDGRRDDRRPHAKGDGKPRPDHRPRRDEAKPMPDRPPREEKPVRIDPDSPFAKLAALREQLKK